MNKAKDEIKDVTKALDNSIHDPGDDNRNFFGQLRETRLSETVNNIAGERLKVAQTRKEIASAFEEAYSDLGYKNVRVIFTTPEHASQLIDENGKPKAGTAYINKKTGEKTIFINENADENQTKTGLIGVIAEEGSHIINGVEGRQIETGTEEKGLESTGRATNEYFQEKYKDDTDKLIIHKSDGIDYSGVDFGENVGDKIKVYYAFGTLEAGYLIVGKFTAIVGYAVGDKGAPQYFITFSGGGGLGLGAGGSVGGGFTYLENKRLVTDKFFLVIIIFVIAFVLFAFWKWFKGSISLRDKQLSMLGLMIIFLFGLYHFENYRANNNREKVYKNSASVIKKLAEKFKVGENEIFINTPEITEHTVYKIRDKFYQIHWVDNNILVEQMTVPYVDEIKTFKE